MASRWPAPDLASTFQRRRRTDQWGATQGSDFLFLALEKTHGQHEVNVGRAKMFHVLKRCQRLLSPVFTGTVSPALTRLEPRASRHSPTWRRSFALNVSPCQRRWRANSSHPVTTRRFSEERRESGDQDGDAAAVQGETMDIDRRSESQGSAMVRIGRFLLHSELRGKEDKQPFTLTHTSTDNLEAKHFIHMTTQCALHDLKKKRKEVFKDKVQKKKDSLKYINRAVIKESRILFFFFKKKMIIKYDRMNKSTQT